MSLPRRITIFIFGFVLRTSIFLGFTIFAAFLVIGNKDNIKSEINDIDAYDRFSTAVVEEVKNGSADDISSIPFTDETVQKIVKQSLDSKSLQLISEQLIDTSFEYLEGNTENFVFSYDITSNKEVFARGISNYAFDRLATSKPCTTLPPDTNIFGLNCNPTFLDIPMERQNLYNEIYNSEQLYPSNKIELASTDGQVTFGGTDINIEKAKKFYNIFRILPYIFLVIAVFAGIIIVLLSRTRRSGYKSISGYLISSGVVLAITPLLYTYVLPALGLKLPGSGGSGAAAFSAISADLVESLYTRFNGYLINTAIQVVVVGVIVRLILKFTKPNINIYKNVPKKAGITSSVTKSSTKDPKKALTYKSAPIQTSEHQTKSASKKTSKSGEKYRKIMGK